MNVGDASSKSPWKLLASSKTGGNESEMNLSCKVIGMVRVQVFGTEPPCAKCKATEKLVRKLVKKLGLDAEVEKVNVFSEEAERLGIMMSPAVVINGKLVKHGGVPTEKELREALEAVARS